MNRSEMHGLNSGFCHILEISTLLKHIQVASTFFCTFTCCFLRLPLVGGRYSIWAMLWHLWERYPSLSTQAMYGGIILQCPFHLWPPMGSSSRLGQIGGGEGQQTLSPFSIICPAVDCLPLDGFVSGVVALQHAHGADV